MRSSLSAMGPIQKIGQQERVALDPPRLKTRKFK